MFKHFFQFVIALMLLLTGFVSVADESKPTIYVDGNSTRAKEDGSKATPYKTISKALQNAPKGSTIIVKSAVYRENITIGDGLQIIGEGDKRPIIQAANPKKPTVILQGDVSIEFFKITGGNDGILVRLASRVNIKGNEIVQNNGDGIKFQKPKKAGDMPAIAFIMENIISKNDDGIDIEGSKGLIQKNKIFKNRDDGIDYDGDADVKTIENEIISNKDDGIEIRLYRKVRAYIEGNVITQNGEDGIEVINTPKKDKPTDNRVRIIKNTIRKNKRYGIGCVNVKTEDVKEFFEEDAVVYLDNIVTENRKGQIVGVRLQTKAGTSVRRDPPKSWNFDTDPLGRTVLRFRIAETVGKGNLATWQVIKDATAPSPPNVFALIKTENHRSTFNLAITEGTSYTDMDISVRVKAISGREDQGGGPIWRAWDANNYYIAQWNPLEDNFRVYFVKNGRRKRLGSANVKAPSDQWHTIRIVMIRQKIEAYFNGKKLITIEDDTFAEAGMVGLWTKADAATSFDDLSVKPIQ